MNNREPSTKNSASRIERRTVSMDGHVIRAGGVRRDIDVTDLNYNGCGIRTPIDLEVGELVEISVLGRGSIAAEVRWCDEGKAGLVFEPVSADDEADQVSRTAERTSVPGEVGLRVSGRANYQVDVRDLSTDGCKVELVERPAVGDQMLVKFDGLEVLGAKAVWVDGYTGGLKFERPLHPAVLDLLLVRLADNRGENLSFR